MGARHLKNCLDRNQKAPLENNDRHTAGKSTRYIGTRHNHATAHAQAGDRHTPRQMIDTRPVLFVSCVETPYESITFWIQSLELSDPLFVAHSAPCSFAANGIPERATIPCGSLPG